MKNVVIVSATRTALGSFMGSLSSVPATELGSAAIKGAMDRISLDPRSVDEVLMGCVLQANVGQAPARQAALGAGLSHHIPCTTVNKVCASGMKAIMLGAQSIALGHAEVVVAGGMENMSQVPHYLPNSRKGFKFGDSAMVDGLSKDGLINVYDGQVMGVCADLCATEHNFSREDQDAFSVWSQEKTAQAQASGYFKGEIVPVSIPQRKKDPVVVSVDEFPKPNSSLTALAGLRPAFRKDGSVTAGNSSGLNDGAAACLVASEAAVQAHGLTPLARIVASAVVGVEPRTMGIGPVPATQKALAKAGLSLDDMDIIELNEAFAAQALACSRALGLDDRDPRINPNGGSIAIGHPLGMSGARLALTAARQLKARKGKYALVTMCIGVGQGYAVILANPEV